MTTALPALATPPGLSLTGEACWLQVARELADDLATDAAVREQAGKAPVDEVARLREAGLLTLLVPAEHGGGGADWRTAYAVVRTIAAADGAIGQLLGCHLFLLFSARFFARPALVTRVERESAAGQWRAAAALADQAVEALTCGLARGEDIDDNECAEIAVLAGAAEAAASRAAQEVTTRALDVIGVHAASPRHGFDRFWRNARTHTLREPVADRLREVGDYFLHGVHPPFTLPS